jgi:hypothetical protein
MTEAEWDACANPDRLLPYAQGRLPATRPGLLGRLFGRRTEGGPPEKAASQRKVRLYACDGVMHVTSGCACEGGYHAVPLA